MLEKPGMEMLKEEECERARAGGFGGRRGFLTDGKAIVESGRRGLGRCEGNIEKLHP